MPLSPPNTPEQVPMAECHKIVSFTGIFMPKSDCTEKSIIAAPIVIVRRDCGTEFIKEAVKKILKARAMAKYRYSFAMSNGFSALEYCARLVKNIGINIPYSV